jgi:hypothetical protein
MDNATEVYENLIRSAARRLKGHARRLFQAEVADALCHGSPRAAERRFGFDRASVIVSPTCGHLFRTVRVLFPRGAGQAWLGSRG